MDDWSWHNRNMSPFWKRIGRWIVALFVRLGNGLCFVFCSLLSCGALHDEEADWWVVYTNEVFLIPCCYFQFNLVN